jgi:two-component system, sensor histidine kinase and response regulator
VISKELTELMGGEVGVESVQGKGCTFWACINVGIAVIDGPIELIGLDAEPAVLPSGFEGRRILLAEDNLLNQQIAQELLEEFGLYICVANNGREAIEILQREVFDCVLMDVRMPEMDGIEATRHIRADKQFGAMPIIAMTANARAEDREECLQAGMNDFISKPVDPAQFFRILLKWLRPAVGHTESEAVAELLLAVPELEVDMQALAILTRNDAAKILRLCNIFLSSTRTGIGQIADALNSGDMGGLGEIGHRYKSSSRSMGAGHLADLFGHLEAVAKTGDVAQVNLVSQEISEVWQRIEVELAAFLAERTGA